MGYEDKKIYNSDFLRNDLGSEFDLNKSIYYGEVISIEDDNDGGRIKVRIQNLDNNTLADNLPDCYPLLPKFFHIYPKVGEIVRVLIENTKYPNRSRYYIGSVISQLQNLKFDGMYTALSTTNMGTSKPLAAISTYPDAEGVFPNKEDVAIIGRENTDVVLRINDVEIRAGKHENDNPLKLNKQNPASIRLTFEKNTSDPNYTSKTVIMSDKIALISHNGDPKFKASQLSQKDRDLIFVNAHPMGRGDVIVEAFEILRKAMLTHIHGYNGMESDKSGSILDLEKIDFTQILQKNIVIN